MDYKISGDDKQLLKKIAEADYVAFRELFDAYHNLVFTYALSYVKFVDTAEDIVQEVFIKIWANREALTEVENFGGYIRVLTINKTKDELKKAAVSIRNEQESLKDWSELDFATEQNIISKHSGSYIDMLIDRLPKQQKLVYRMFYVDGLKQKEIAKELNISPLTVKVHLREALKTLKSILNTKGSLPLLSYIFLGLLK
jgi:RNA polymerase sigma-70 factor (family 1)